MLKVEVEQLQLLRELVKTAVNYSNALGEKYEPRVDFNVFTVTYCEFE